MQVSTPNTTKPPVTTILTVEPTIVTVLIAPNSVITKLPSVTIIPTGWFPKAYHEQSHWPTLQ